MQISVFSAKYSIFGGIFLWNLFPDDDIIFLQGVPEFIKRIDIMSGFLNFTREKQIKKVIELDVDSIVPNPNQPRTDFSESDISALSDSIAQNGILQPLCVRKCGDSYELIAGERRLRAAKMCGLRTVPCIIHDMSDRESAILALVENIQRQDLSFFDEAAAIEKLISFYGMTQEEAAEKLGKAQSTIANKLRLLRLTPDERMLITKFELTERHSRALLKLASPEDRIIVLEKVINNKLNVDRTERLIEEYIGSSREKHSYKKRSKVFQNVKIFINTINRAVETMQAAGIPADSRKIQGDDYVEYRVRIPMQKR